MSGVVAALARRSLPLLLVVPLLVVPLLAPSGATERVAPSAAGAVAQPVLAPGFEDEVVITGTTSLTVVDFAPDGRTAFLANQSGRIFTAAREGDRFGAPQPFADLTKQVHQFFDRGMLGLAVDPDLGAGTGRDFVYTTYVLNRDPRDPASVVPRWNPDAGDYDDCPEDAQASTDGPAGCIVTIRVSRLPVAPVGGGGWVLAGPEQPLLESGCLQFYSHGSGAVKVGPDGMLYVSAGEGAWWDGEADYGQFGGDDNCSRAGDPVDEGGALRAQDVRTTGDPLGMNGAVVRVDPLASAVSTTPDVVAYGMRNPWRLAFRPGTDEAWVADVGQDGFEEVNRLIGLTDRAKKPTNFGWPCYEGPAPMPDWHSSEPRKPLCTSLYTAAENAPERAVEPYHSYSHEEPVVPGDGCRDADGSSVSGVQFLTSPSYPDGVRGALAFADFARGCIWYAPLGADDQPDAARTELLVSGLSAPVDLTTGPDGDLYYVDYGLEGVGTVHRISLSDGTPTARVRTTTPPYGGQPLTVTFDASHSTDPEPNPTRLSYSWDFDQDGQFDDGVGSGVTHTFTGDRPVGVSVRVTDLDGKVSVASTTVHPGNDPPQITAFAPGADLTWSVGEQIPYSVTATDKRVVDPDGLRYSWSLAVAHCPLAGTGCHLHPTTRTGPAGVFTAPNHDLPSHLVLRVTVSDGALMATETVKLQPETVRLTFTTTPVGAPITLRGRTRPAPVTEELIVGAPFSASVPDSVVVGGQEHRFLSWSGGQSRFFEAVAPAADTTYTASYRSTAPPAPATAPLTVRSAPARLKVPVRVDGVPHRGAWTGTFQVGQRVRVEAPAKLKKRGVVHVFRRWSDGGRRSHLVTVRAGGLVVRAVYAVRR